MGAMPWQIVGPYDPDPLTALRKIQREYFDENYDLQANIAEALHNAEECVSAVKENDEYGLFDTYNETLQAVAEQSRKPIPKDVDEQIDFLRNLVRISGESLDNILDIVGVSEELEMWRVAKLSDEESEQVFGTTRPTRLVAERNIFRVFNLLNRAECLSVTLYRERMPRRALRIIYFGLTAD